MNFNSKRKERSAKSFFIVFKLLKLKKINFISVKDQLEQNTDDNRKNMHFLIKKLHTIYAALSR